MLVTILLVALSLFALASVAWFVVVEFVVHKRADAETAKPTPDFAELAQDHPDRPASAALSRRPFSPVTPREPCLGVAVPLLARPSPHRRAAPGARRSPRSGRRLHAIPATVRGGDGGDDGCARARSRLAPASGCGRPGRTARRGAAGSAAMPGPASATSTRPSRRRFGSRRTVTVARQGMPHGIRRQGGHGLRIRSRSPVTTRPSDATSSTGRPGCTARTSDTTSRSRSAGRPVRGCDTPLSRSVRRAGRRRSGTSGSPPRMRRIASSVWSAVRGAPVRWSAE